MSGQLISNRIIGAFGAIAAAVLVSVLLIQVVAGGGNKVDWCHYAAKPNPQATQNILQLHLPLSAIENAGHFDHPKDHQGLCGYGI